MKLFIRMLHKEEAMAMKNSFDGEFIKLMQLIGNGTASRETEFLSRKLRLTNRCRFYCFEAGSVGVFSI
jgi:hypothetical protein